MIALDMEMPDVCYECNQSFCIEGGGRCHLTGGFIEYGWKERPSWCPLMEVNNG